MNTRKTQIRYFDVMDYEKEAEYLSDMHAQGWKFVYVGFPGIYNFVRCEPEKVRYQLDYNQEGLKNMDEYRQMFADMGWEFLFEFVGYSYFRKPITDEDSAEEIFCDDDSRWEMLKRIFTGRIIPLIVLFLLVIVPYILTAIAGSRAGSHLPNGMNLYMWILFILYLAIFVRFAVKFFAFKERLGK